jgi:uncharacterized protein YabN with tetrapyrrole methylase and pyrophosphatase domain
MTPLQKLIALEQKTSLMGFDWPNTETIIDQAISECHEVKLTIQAHEGRKRLQEEVGDLLHATISLCLFEGLDVDETLEHVNKKFEARLDALQQIAKDRGFSTLKGQHFALLLELWEEAKHVANNLSKIS